MFNPFVRFMPELIDAFLRHEEHLLVSQTFRAAKQALPEEGHALMFSQYNDLSYAQVHLQALRGDRFAAIVDLRKEKHRTRVMELLQPGSGYLVFSNLIRDQHSVEDYADRHYTVKLRKYLETNTRWRISATASLRPKLQLIFGELHIILKYEKEQLRIRLEDLEAL